MSADVEVDGLRPGKVRNKTTTAKKFAVIVDWDPPNAWEDLSTSGFDLATAVSHYEVDLVSGGSVVAQDLHVVRTKVRFDRDVGSGPYSSKVRVIGHDMEFATEDAASGSATPEGVSFGETTGAITKTQMGTLGISRYGTTTQMNAAVAVDGDIWINTSFTPKRVYRYEAGAWQYAVDGAVLVAGTVIADAVVAGAIDGHTITGAIFRTANSATPRLQINASDMDIHWYSGAGANLAWVGRAAGNLHVWEDTGTLFLHGSGGIYLDGGGDVTLDSPLEMLAAVDLNGNNLNNIASDALKFSTRTLTATAGAQGAPPGQVAGYVRITVEGVNYKVPFYNI